MTEENAIVVHPQSGFMAPVVSVKDALFAYQAKKELIDGIMVKGVDYGIIPGTGTKAVLLKAGAEKATSFFGLSPRFTDAEVINDWTGEQHGGEPFFFYRRTCNLWRGDALVASVDGSCNSWEKKYRYRNSDRTCPQCGKTTIIKGKEEYGGGWICFAKKGGCGAKFSDSDPKITGQETGQVKNPDIADLPNTILKMADKRALVAATLIATGLSEYFTQDVEDFVSPGEYVDAQVRDVTPPPPAQKKTEPVKEPASDRPYQPQVFKVKFENMVKAMENKGAVTVGEKDGQVLAAAIDGIYEGDALKRHEFTNWLTGHSSTKEMTPAQIKALLRIMDVSGFDQPPSVISMKEIKMAHSEALREMGQTEFPFEEAPQ